MDNNTTMLWTIVSLVGLLVVVMIFFFQFVVEQNEQDLTERYIAAGGKPICLEFGYPIKDKAQD